ncbi:hypothetical protein BKA62DRAFT_825455 [Auriculariales sp. MPI-PUGE-AT-0066]|nr:hypothetical protein BKA62DRAFT_825455 [Auriculariales sp. MPI-PUGE-AT-0066]
MSRFIRIVKRMVSWSRDDAPQVHEVGAPTGPMVMPTEPEPFKATKRKYDSGSDDEDADVSTKKSRPYATPPPLDEGASVPPTPAVELDEYDVDVVPTEAFAKPAKPAKTVAAETSSDPAAAPTDVKDGQADAEGDDSPTATPDSPEPQAKPEPPFVLSALNEDEPNVFLTWKDGVVGTLEDTNADETRFWLKSQIVEAYGTTEEEVTERVDTVGYWSFEVDEEALHTPAATALRSAFKEAHAADDAKDVWWWEVTVQRNEPADSTPRIKAKLESSEHHDDHDVSGGQKLGEWWIIDLKPASSDVAKAIQTHRDTY